MALHDLEGGNEVVYGVQLRSCASRAFFVTAAGVFLLHVWNPLGRYHRFSYRMALLAFLFRGLET